MLSWITAQGLKLIIYLVTEGRINVAKLIDTGGMPSSHTAFVVSLCTSVGLIEGFHTTEFGISAVLAAVVIYDATGIRRSAGHQAAALNEIIPQLLAGKFLSHRQEFAREFKELLGHNPIEVSVGALVGFVVTVAYLYGYNIVPFTSGGNP